MSFSGDLLRPFGAMVVAARQLRFRLITFAVIGFTAGQVSAQTVTPEQLQQLQQVQQSRVGSPTIVQPSVTNQQTILEPVGAPAVQVPSRLETLLSERAGARLQLFGYDQLGGGRSVSLPQVGAVQDSYLLGPGDEVVVTFRGQENSEYRATVDRDGQVTLPRLNPVSAAGRTFGQFRQDILNAIHRAYVSTDGFVSIGRMRQISVMVSGEVGSPGMRTMTGLSSVADAILISGGVKKSGSLRNVRLIRSGREIPIDLYGILSGQVRASSITLTEGDRIIVPFIGKTVAVTGWVRKPAIYELPAGRSAIGVREMINLAGGTEVRGNYRLAVLHTGSDGRNQMTPLAGERGSISDGDILFVQPGVSETSHMAELAGGGALAGKYAVTGSKLSQLLKAPGALGEEPYTLFGIISRRDPTTKLRTLLAFTPVAVLKGTQDLTIMSDDIVRVVSVTEARSLFGAVQRFRIRRTTEQEAVLNPQAVTAETQERSGNRSSNTNNGSNNNSNNGPNNDANNGTNNDNNNGPNNNNSEPNYDTNASGAPGMAANNGAASAAIRGVLTGNGVDSSGALTQGGRSGSVGISDRQDLASASGASLLGAERVGTVRISELAAQLRVDPLVLMSFLDDCAITIDGTVQGPGLYLVGPDSDIQTVLSATGGLTRVADRTNIDVISTVIDGNTGTSRTERRKLSLADGANAGYVLAPRDSVHVNEVYTVSGGGAITLQGQLRHAGTYQILRGDHLSDILVRAGGLTDTAYPYGTVFLRRSVALNEQESYRRQAQAIENQLMTAMTRRDPNSKMSPDSFAAMQSYVKEIRNQKGLGRMVVTADPTILASNPSLDPLLEPNDVIFVPQRPFGVAVLGEVLQPGNIPFRANMSVSDYIESAGGYSRFADEGVTILVLPDGSARRAEQSWFHFGSEVVPPGSTIFVARDVSGVDLHQSLLDFTQIASQLAVSAASLALLSTQIK